MVSGFLSPFISGLFCPECCVWPTNLDLFTGVTFCVAARLWRTCDFFAVGLPVVEDLRNDPHCFERRF